MSAGDLTTAELIRMVSCRSFCGQQAEVWRIGRFYREMCQTCGGNHAAEPSPAAVTPAPAPWFTDADIAEQNDWVASLRFAGESPERIASLTAMLLELDRLQRLVSEPPPARTPDSTPKKPDWFDECEENR